MVQVENARVNAASRIWRLHVSRVDPLERPSRLNPERSNVLAGRGGTEEVLAIQDDTVHVCDKWRSADCGERTVRRYGEPRDLVRGGPRWGKRDIDAGDGARRRGRGRLSFSHLRARYGG